MMRAGWILAGLAMIAGGDANAKPIAFKSGQVWEYRTRPQDGGSLVKIQRISRDRVLGLIYHISLIGLTMRNAEMDGSLMHAPVSREVLDKSVVKRFGGKATFPSADEGIAEWKKAEGGVFTIGLAEIADLVDGTTSKSVP